MTSAQPDPVWSDPTTARPEPGPVLDAPSPWAAPVDPAAPATSMFPAGGPAPIPTQDAIRPAAPIEPPAAIQPAPFIAPAPYTSPNAPADFAVGAAPVAAPPMMPAVSGPGYGPAAYPVTAVAGATYAGYGSAPQYPPPGYAAYPGYPPAYGPPLVKNNGLAIGAMITSIVGAALIVCYGFGGLLGVAGAIMGHVARRQIRTSKESGDGMAKAGVIVGWIALGLSILVWGAIVAFFIWAATQSDPYAYDSTYGD